MPDMPIMNRGAYLRQGSMRVSSRFMLQAQTFRER